MASADLSNRYTYPRILGYSVSLVLHITNMYNMLAFYEGEVLEDPFVKRFYDNQFRFLTIWNICMQVMYLSLGLSCDVLTITNHGKESSLLKSLKTIRDPLFTCLVWPYSFTVCVSFWTIFSYDRALILPPSVDKTITPITNHILHTSIVPIVLWELLFRHRSRPETHLGNLLTINLYAALYLVVIIVAFLEQGVWVYPVLDRLYGTIHFYLFIGAAVVITNVFYKLQWIIVAFLEQGVWVYPILDKLYGTIHFYLFIGAAVVITNIFYKLQWYLTDLVWNRSEDTKKFL